MKNFKAFAIIGFATLIALSACTARKVVPVATGGSKADAAVVMSFNTGLFKPAEPDWATATLAAKKRCQAWGYERAEGYEGLTSVCNRRNGYGNCLDGTVSRTYQCTN